MDSGPIETGCPAVNGTEPDDFPTKSLVRLTSSPESLRYILFNSLPSQFTYPGSYSVTSPEAFVIAGPAIIADIQKRAKTAIQLLCILTPKHFE